MANRLLHKVLSLYNYSYLDRLYCNSQAAYIAAYYLPTCTNIRLSSIASASQLRLSWTIVQEDSSLIIITVVDVGGLPRQSSIQQ